MSGVSSGIEIKVSPFPSEKEERGEEKIIIIIIKNIKNIPPSEKKKKGKPLLDTYHLSSPIDTSLPVSPALSPNANTAAQEPHCYKDLKPPPQVNRLLRFELRISLSSNREALEWHIKLLVPRNR